MVDVVPSFLAAFDEGKEATAVMGTVEEFRVFITPLK
jgi:hypothetical protein